MPHSVQLGHDTRGPCVIAASDGAIKDANGSHAVTIPAEVAEAGSALTVAVGPVGAGRIVPDDPIDLRSDEVRAVEIRAAEIGAGEVHAAEVGIRELGAAK
jgi:hypothetical protein